MPVSHQKEWDTTLRGSIESYPVAEPVDRVGPEGVSSGISFRSLPDPCFEQVKKSCMHYVNKCSGKYHNNRMAARYVHQLASEVLSMLSGIADEVHTHQEMARLAELRFAEWDKKFPESLKRLGGPEEIAQVIYSQEDEISRLRKELDAEKGAKNDDLENIKMSMDHQLHASRVGALGERQHLAMEFNTMKAKMQAQLDECQKKCAAEVKRLNQEHKSEIDRIHKEHMTHRREEKRAFDSTVKRMQEEHQRKESENRQTIADLEDQCAELRTTIRKLEHQMESQSAGGRDSDTDASSDDGSSVMSGTTLMSQTTASAFAEMKKKYTQKYKRKIKRLNKQLDQYKAIVQSKNARIDDLSTQFRNAVEDNCGLNRKVNGLTELNEALRYQLTDAFGFNDGSVDISGAAKKVVYDPDVLNFIVPDFLQKPDKRGI
mmetsp:Transcript_5023/g.7675  ORF Transcript_5023/g.7675 Transcript_5023/m.7675 type:complete len:432 (-) Transcript_5023:143-1438(-)